MDITETKDADGNSILDWEILADRHYTLTSTTFTKRQLRPEERKTNMHGDVIKPPPFSREYLENERDALLFIQQNTTIRVPKFLSFSDEHGLASVTMESVDGKTVSELLDTLTGWDIDQLCTNVSRYINHTVLPQLNNLRSNTLGSVHGKIIPPYVLQKHYDGRTHYPSRTAATKDFVYCHNDLGLHNIIVNEDTLDVAAIIDWEVSGFYPEGFEFPYWLASISHFVDRGEESLATRNVVKLIDEPGTP